MPDEGNMLKFRNHNRSIRVPFVVYADFEVCTEPISGCEPSSDDSFINKYPRHKPSGFGYQIVYFDDNLYSQKPVIYRAKTGDEDVSQIFAEMFEDNIKNIHREFDFAKKMIFTDEDRREFKEATHCWICKRSFDNIKDRSAARWKADKVSYHCNSTGK